MCLKEKCNGGRIVKQSKLSPPNVQNQCILSGNECIFHARVTRINY